METREELLHQYRDGGNLNARIAFHMRFAINPQPWWSWLFEQYTLPVNANILELGAGPGKLWADNAARIPSGWQITLTDFSSGMLDEARRALADVGGQFAFEVVDAMDIPYADATFDAVFANHMLYHVPDRPRAYAHIQRVLKPGGSFYAATNGKDHLRELRELVERFAPGAGIWDAFMDMQRFTLEAGAGELAAWFPEVAIRRQDNSLRVTEAAPLVAYIASAADATALPAQRLPEFTQFVEAEIEAAGGALHITRDSGVFIAKRHA